MKSILTVLTVVFCTVLYGQNTQPVSGIVTDEEGSSLPGVSVKIKGTSTGTVTNGEGKYSINADANGTIVFSFVGYKTLEIAIEGKTSVDATMTEGILMDEVVVTALGISRDRKALGYAVQKVGGDQISKSRETNMISGMAAKVSGVQITNSSGAAGGASYMKIRGNASLTGNNQPLFVVDGVPIRNDQNVGSDFDLRDGVALSNRAIDINPDDIEDISVLKGGAAAALYGSRGANGVVLITTKKGSMAQDGKNSMNISFNTNVEISNVNKLPKTQNLYSQGYFGEAYSPHTGNPFSFGPAIADLEYDGDNTYEYNPNGRLVHKDSAGANGVPAQSFNNAENFFQTGVKEQYSLALDGSNKFGSFFLSYSHLDEKGVVPLNTFLRNTFRLTGTSNLNDKLTATGSVAYTNSQGRRIQQGSNLSGLMLGLLRASPTFDNSNGATDVTDPSSFLLADGSQRNYRGGGGYDNPYWTINQNPFTDQVNRVFGYGKLDYKFNDWITATARVGSDYYSDVRNQIFAINSRSFPAGRVQEDLYNTSETTADLFLSFNKSLNESIRINGIVGQNYNHRSFKNDYLTGDALNFPNFYNLSNTASIVGGASTQTVRTSGTYIDINASINDTYYIGFTGRQDAASTFGSATENTFFYPSVSASIILSELLNVDDKLLSFAKLRGSYSIVGNEPGAYNTRTYFTSSSPYSGWIGSFTFPFEGLSAFTQSNSLGNPNLRPEQVSTMEIGADISLLEGKLNLDVTYYNQYSTDLILAVPVAASSGFTSRTINAGEMSNKGIELTLGANLVDNDNFKWNFDLNYTRNRNMVEKLADGVEVVSLPWGFTGANQRLVTDQAYGTLYGSVWDRNADGDIYVDANGVPVQATNDSIVGDPNPDWLMGINNNLQIGNLSFSFLWDIRVGGDIWNGTRGALYYFGMHENTALVDDETGVARDETFVFEGVYAPGTVDADGNDISGQANTIPITKDISWYALGPGSGFTGPSEQFVEDGGWVRLRQLSLNYDFSDMVKNSKFIKGLTFGITARNLFLSTKYTGVDPETSLSGTTNAQGADYFNMPNTRSFTFNLRANF